MRMKRAANLPENDALLDEAKALGVNLSRALHNRRVAKRGVFSDRLRRF